MDSRTSSLSSLSRFRIQDEHLIVDDIVKAELKTAFGENRCFAFTPDPDLVTRLKSGDPVAIYRELFLGMRNRIFDDVSKDDGTVKTRLLSDTRLSSRLMGALTFIHRALGEGSFTSLPARRFVIVKERHGSPTILHVSPETTVLAHVGQGPEWQETPSVYLGLNLFDALGYELKRGGRELYGAFLSLLAVEERAIETGYSHITVFPPEVSRSFVTLLDEVIRGFTRAELEYEEAPVEKAVRKFTARDRQKYLKLLNARVPGDELNFLHDECVKAMDGIERLARTFKRAGDRKSLRELMRILVAAAGHDLHEVRDRANVVLERIFAPKEFDAPLSARFATVNAGSIHWFSFDLPRDKAEYYLRIYRNTSVDGISVEKDIAWEECALTFDPSYNRFVGAWAFAEYGHYDYLVCRRSRRKHDWVARADTSGRVNVIPDVRGQIILEIFTDIHGHTKAYWMDPQGRTGLLYNENGEVIRLGRFSDVTAHLDDLADRYRITAIYLLGVQRRGSNSEDWAPEASSPSPFSPMSLVEIEPSLGGEADFLDLVRAAHARDLKIIVDIVPHLNRRATELPVECVAQCYDGSGNLVERASTDGRYGSWNDGRLYNYRMLQVWDWLAESILALIEKYDIDGIRFDSAHAVPIVMKRNNYLYVYDRARSDEEMVEGRIIVNEREDGHFITTGYYDCACRDVIAIPIHYYMMLRIERALMEKGKTYFLNIAECYWGHERFLTRVGIIPYNSALFKVCENIIHGKTDVREIYHIYDNYFPAALPPGTELLGILGNHDERRALNTFGHRGLRAAVGITTFMNNIIMDYEGSAEGEGWKVFLDNIFVNWNSFEYASHRSLDRFYREWYSFHRENRGRGYLVWANNTMVAASAKFTDTGIFLGVFNFADSTQHASIQFDNPALPIPDSAYYRVEDIIYSQVTGHYSYYKGRELKSARINTIVSYTDRVKLLRLRAVDNPEDYYADFLRDSFFRLCAISGLELFSSNFAFNELCAHASHFEEFAGYVSEHLVPLFWDRNRYELEIGIKRALFHMVEDGYLSAAGATGFIAEFARHGDDKLRALGASLESHNRRDPMVFLSAEADPFSKSGGLANVVYELPRELVKMGEEVYVITGFYRSGDEKAVARMQDAVKKYDIRYTGVNVRFRIMGAEYEVGVSRGTVDGIGYFLLDHYEFFDGLYWGITSEEKLRRRIAFARACAEVICTFGLRPLFTFTNDAYAGLFNGIVRSDHVYRENPNFFRTTFLHIIHNGGWQYFDSYHRWERGFDLFGLFNLPSWRAAEFSDPVHGDRLNCMSAGIRFADRTITVSPSYAVQIEYASDGLEHILHDVIGISNAIGRDFKERIGANFASSRFIERNEGKLLETIRGNTALEEKIAQRCPELLKPGGIDSITNADRLWMARRLRNKLILQMERGLAVDPDCMLFCMIHRITEQKGFQLLLESSKGLFDTLGLQAIIGGAVSSGDRRGEDLAHGLYLLSQIYPDSVNVSFGFQDISVPLLSSDIFGMPSMNEPGGISQIEAFSAGCLVVARATGGLRDTVVPVRVREDEVEGNGFLFSDFTSSAFYDAMARANEFMTGMSAEIVHRARMNAENSVYYWDRPARKYIEQIYRIKEIIREM
ncbi:MAG: glycosyltransferase [Spirochaetes bacterium]|nr:MAG: glycosyltransferase [Spirochaetota bacterium]